MRQFPHLKRNHRSGNWVYFRRFPLALQPQLGRVFFERSLGTADRAQIPAAWAKANSEFESLLARAECCDGATLSPASPGAVQPWFTVKPASKPWRGNVAATVAPLELGLGSVSEAVKLWGERERYQRAQRLLNEPERSRDETDFVAECQLVGACGHARTWLFHCPPLLALTESILHEHGIRVPAMHSALFTIQRMVEAELRAVLEAEAKWRNFDFTDLPRQGPAAASSHPNKVNRTSTILLHQLVEEYVAATRKPIKTSSKLRMVARYINDLNGSDVLAADVTKDLLRRLQVEAYKVPARLKMAERKLTFVQLASLPADQSAGRPTLTPQAVRSWFNLLGACFAWAASCDLIEQNPTAGVKPKVRPLEISPRSPFSDDDLKKIFCPDYYPKCHEEERFWIPLLGLFTGARLNEIGQLLVKDVVFSPVPALMITDLADDPAVSKRLKNLSSRRTIPIHPILISLGFEDYVKSKTSSYLFPRLPHSGRYEPTKAFSQWFGRYLGKIGVKGRGKVFHSFRHTFKDACRRAMLDEETHDALTGHRYRASVGRSYGNGIPLAVLSGAVARITFFNDQKRLDLLVE
ncbi:hypothetical protein [Methylobacterium sp. ID0610]|uniref:hypothetical protein n=1 Tax=Methylobacterium carpenticola TaxID=3344827 RepID=UPI0036AC7AF4